MEDPKTIKSGTYKTLIGEIAHVWDWGQNMCLDWCYRGTIEGQGFCTWDENGKDLDGDSHLILK